MNRTLCTRATIALACAAGLAGQDRPAGNRTDLRDAVTLMSGDIVRGRVLRRFDPGELVVVQGGKRVRVPRADMRDVHTVEDDVRQFFAHRAAAVDNPKRGWFLVEWASSKELPGLARLQALAIVLKDPKHAAAHEFLGHRRRGDEWLWPVGDAFRTRAAFDEHHAKLGTALVLSGEHFVIRTDAGLAQAVPMLFDLERVYLFWQDTFGEALHMQTALDPIEMQVSGSASKFPKISAAPLPYYKLDTASGATFFRPDGKRPEQLFGIATQAMIYATLIEGRPVNRQTHVCAWLEIGLGLWVEGAFGGAPGKAEPLPKVVLDPLTASTVFRMRPRLNRTIHLHYELFFELSRRTALRWGATESLVHYLMSGKPDPKLRQRFLAYVERVFRGGVGDSSSAFDQAMGEKVEDMEPKFFRWLQVHQN